MYIAPYFSVSLYLLFTWSRHFSSLFITFCHQVLRNPMLFYYGYSKVPERACNSECL